MIGVSDICMAEICVEGIESAHVWSCLNVINRDLMTLNNEFGTSLKILYVCV